MSVTPTAHEIAVQLQQLYLVHEHRIKQLEADLEMAQLSIKHLLGQCDRLGKLVK